eukprot:3734627-Amphidinium_carterae.1
MFQRVAQNYEAEWRQLPSAFESGLVHNMNTCCMLDVVCAVTFAEFGPQTIVLKWFIRSHAVHVEVLVKQLRLVCGAHPH